MVGTIVVHGSDGEVMAPIESGRFIKGKRRNVLITAASSDEDLPLHVRQALVGLTISTIFSPEQVNGAAPEESRVAYASEVAEALEAADKVEVAEDFLTALKENRCDGEYDLIVFKSGEYELVA